MEYADVSNPDSIRITPLFFTLPYFVTAAYARDTLLFVNNGIYSITTPHSPVRLANISITSPNSIAMRGDTAFFGNNNNIITTVDISNPRNPIVLGSYDPQISISEHALSAKYLAVQDTTLYSSYGKGLTVFSVRNPSAIRILSFLPTGQENNNVVVRNRIAYVTSGFGGLWIGAVSNPSRTRPLGYFATPGYAYGLIVDSNVAYVSINHPMYFSNEEAWNGIMTLDVSRPESVRVLGTFQTGSPLAISKSGSLLFVSHGNTIAPEPDTTLTILDVSNPSTLRRAGCVVAGYAVYEIATRDSIAFLCTYTGLKIFDCRNLANPQLLSSSLRSARGISLKNQLAYVHRSDSTFVVDISNLSMPRILGGVRYQTSPAEGGWESLVKDNRVWWANLIKFGAIDVSSPSQPRSLFENPPGTSGIFDWGSGISIATDTIFVTSRSSGVWIFRYKAGSTSVREAGQPVAKAIRLLSNYPNPFNTTTQLRFAISTSQKVRLEIFDLLGKHVAILLNNMLESGEHTIEFDARDLPSGIYFYKLQTATSLVGKMILIK